LLVFSARDWLQRHPTTPVGGHCPGREVDGQLSAGLLARRRSYLLVQPSVQRLDPSVQVIAVDAEEIINGVVKKYIVCHAIALLWKK
jgi:hypothetical protein